MNRVRNALDFIPADERSTWVHMAMALKTEFGEAGFDLWNDWSQSASNYNAQAARAVWKSCKGVGITIATLLHEAKKYGFKDDQTYTKPTREQIEARARARAERASKEGQEAIRLAKLAAKKAMFIMDQCKPEKHAYLQMKGWPDMEGLVYRPDAETNLLCIPVYVGHDLSSVQMIDKHGVKKFLKDGVTAGGQFVMDSGAINPRHVWCEGFATGLSVHAALQAIKARHIIHICFSAGNMSRMAHSGIVIADRDLSGAGEKAAIATGLPYFLPPSGDFNDLHKEAGLFKCSQELRKFLFSLKEEV